MIKKEERLHLYEGMYIISATLSDDARQKALEKVLGGMRENGGEVHKIHEQGRKKLAYEIAGHREGYYYLVYFSVHGEQVAGLWKEYHLNEDLVRFMMLRTEKVREKLEFKSLVQQ